MTDLSTRLGLPFLLPAQAQKHVTHNEALRLLDLLVQLGVMGFEATDPPAAPEDGQIWALGAAPTGVWAGQGGKLAARTQNDWIFIVPEPGWLASSGSSLRVYADGAWVTPELGALQNLPGLGVNTAHDMTNRLAVAADATLLSHDGGGHQLKVNKNAATDTASLLFQTAWSGRAEMGLAGNDDFAVKVSPDALDWFDALSIDRASGLVNLPNGVSVSGAVTFATPLTLAHGGTGAATATGARSNLGLGTAAVADVTAGASDITEGRVMRVGAGGVLGGAASLAGNQPIHARELRGGIYQYVTSATPGGPESDSWFHTLFLGNLREGTDRRAALDIRTVGNSNVRAWIGATSDMSGEFFWDRLVTSRTVLGTVSQQGGVPTGAVIERGSNSNGEFVRFADGTQICFVRDFDLGSVVAAGSGTFADPFRTDAFQSITWPAVFVAAPTVSHTLRLSGDNTVVANARALLLQVTNAPTATVWNSLRAQRVSSETTDRNALLSVIATGRWF